MTKPFIIAELGSNYKSFEDCKNAVAIAKQCGADAIKFQAFTDAELYGPFVPSAVNTILDLPKLKEKADACGIELMCTAFNPKTYEAIDPFVSRHKIASSELSHIRILQKVNELKKPVILSTGASGEGDINMALGILTDVPVTLLYCVGAYPSTSNDLSQIRKLHKLFHKHVGLSDHSLEVFMPYEAMKYGASVIEKHFNPHGYTDTPDAGHSLSTVEFRLMCRKIEGDELPRRSYQENEMVTKHNRRLIAIQDIKAGEAFKENENFGIYRSLKEDAEGMHPFLADRLEGQVSKMDLKQGQPIPPKAVQ